MTIEEAFKIIRGFLNYGIKHYEHNIKEIEEIDKEAKMYLKPEVYSPRKLLLNDKSLLTEYLKQRDNAKRAVLESEKKLDRIRIMKEFFGKSHILKKVVDFEVFFINLNYINSVLETAIQKEIIAQIIGMAIFNNNDIYDKKKDELENDLNSKNVLLRKECQIVRNLKPYFNTKGEIVPNRKVFFFIENLTNLFNLYPDRKDVQGIPGRKEFPTSLLVKIMTNNLLDTNNKKEDLSVPVVLNNPVISKKERRKMIEQQRINEIELAKYFDGENILMPCTSLENFITLVESCNLNEENKKRIITKMKTFMSKEDYKIPFLTLEEQEIFKIAQEKQIGNVQIKTNINEINMYLEMYPASSLEDKSYIENEVKTLIERLRFILNINFKELLLQKKEGSN